MQLEEAYTAEITKLVKYVKRKENTPKQIVRKHNTTSTQQCYRQLDTSRQKYREEQNK